MNNSVFRTCYDILVKIYRDNGYYNLIMKDISNKRVAKIINGVLEKHYELQYIVGSLTDKNVKASIKPALYIGAYCILYMDTPINVVINETNELLTSLGKDGIKNFTTAILKKIYKKEFSMPSKSDKNYCEVKYNLPSFIVGMYRKDYPENFEDIIFAKPYQRTHVRLNKNTSEKEILIADDTAEKTLTGYFVKNNKEIAMLNFMGRLTYMSFTSTLIVESIPVDGKTVLDLCAAPGGKSVFLAQNGGKVTACDIHEHRVDLIRSYAKRMSQSLSIKTWDGRTENTDWIEKFDVVLVDAPCSGFGVVGKRKDIIFNRTYDDITNLVKTQNELLEQAKKYVKKGGLLVYSTCTVFKKENNENIDAFLSMNENFHRQKINLPYENVGEIQFLPDGKGMEGYYLCHLKKD